MKLVLTLFILFSNVLLAKDKMMSVQVKDTILRTQPSFLGKKITNLKYGDTVQVKSTKKEWNKVFVQNIQKSGWLHISALTNKRVILAKSDLSIQTTASSGEIIMAGKGFSKSVENSYSKSHKYLNYKLVDKIESQNINTNKIIQFAEEGKLNLTY